MSIQVEELEYCKLKIQYIAEPETVNNKREEAVKVLKKEKIQVPGFRPGKATTKAIKTHCGKWIETWVKKEMVSHAYDDVLFETKMKPIGFPQVLNAQLMGASFVCDMIFLKKPDFELKEYKGFEIPKPHQNYNVAELTEKMMQELRERHGEVAPYDDNDFVQVGDQVTMSYECKIDDKVFDEFSNEAALYKVGESLIPDFDNNILGMNAGENRKFDIIFVDGVKEELVNKRAKFDVTLHMGTKNIPCPLDDTLAEKVGLKDFNELRARVQGDASRQLQSINMQLLNQQVIRRLIDNHDFEVPSWLLLMESQKLAAQYSVDWETLDDEQKKQLNDRSKDGIKLSLILDSIRDVEPDAVFSDEEILQTIKRRVESNGQNGDEFIQSAQQNGSLIGMISSLKDEGTIQWLISQSKIIE